MAVLTYYGTFVSIYIIDKVLSFGNLNIIHLDQTSHFYEMQWLCSQRLKAESNTPQSSFFHEPVT